MHAGEVEIDAALARQLIASQFPFLADLPLQIVVPWGTDNAVWRLGTDHVARFPRIDWAKDQPAQDHWLLRHVARHLSVEIPEPIAVGRPALSYPFEWSIHRWIEGEGAELRLMSDPLEFARDLAAVVRQLQEVPIEGAPPSRNRARPLRTYDEDTRRAIDRASQLIDAEAALAVWSDALAASPHDGPDVWVQGDLEGNCLVADGRLCGIIDWGSACRGDPAVDVQVIWSQLFTEASRQLFLETLDIDDATLRRSRGAAVNQACAALPYYVETYPLIVDRSRHKLAALDIALRTG